MNEIKRWGEKFIVLLVVFLLIFPFDLPAKKKGARLEVTKKDGVIVIGELLQVKEKSLVLMTNSETGVTVDINEVRKIIIIKKSKILQGIGWGALIGAVISVPIIIFFAEVYEGVTFQGALIMGIGCAIPAGGIGALVGAASKGYKEIQVEGKSQGEINGILLQLKKKARIK